jgi:prepilin-type N-terminal cleavage/methylation domain-containing protein
MDRGRRGHGDAVDVGRLCRRVEPIVPVGGPITGKPAARSDDSPEVCRLRTDRSPRASAVAGFTLVELVVVVAVVGIVAMLAVPMFKERADLRLRGAAAVLAADLDAARIESLGHADDPRVIVFDVAAESYHVAASSDPATPLTFSAQRRPWLVAFGHDAARAFEGVGIRSVSVGGDDTLGFAAFGHLDQPTDATIELEADGLRLVLTLDATTGETTVGDLHTP